MKAFTRNQIVALSLTLALTASGVSASGTEEGAGDFSAPDFHFLMEETPLGLSTFSMTAYPYSLKNVYNMRGLPMALTGDTVKSVAINPTGINFAVVTADKKGRRNMKVYSNTEQDAVKHKLDTKRFGQPRAVAYTPDALNIVVATDTAVLMFDARKFNLTGSMPLIHPADKIALSGNGYHLATVSGPLVTVYNIEDKKVRHKWNFETGVNDIIFSDDDSEFAVLTDDGQANIYDTRSFIVKNTVENIGEALSGSYNFDGKYMVVAQSPTSIAIVNLLVPDSARQTINVPSGMVSDVEFIPDSKRNTLLVYNTEKAVDVRRMKSLEPFYNRLVDDEVNKLMNEWLKMMPGESLEEYHNRVNDETRARQRRQFEDEVATRLAPDMVAMAQVSLGQYDDRHGLLEVSFSNMPSIYLPVAADEVGAFSNADNLQFSNARYAVDALDRFEMIYAEVLNSADGKTYIYNNIDRAELNFMQADEEEEVSLALIEQQMMEEIKLRELQEKIVEEAKSRDIISDHTNITVATEVVPDYDADGRRIFNYKVSYTYEVDPGYTAREDFGPGKYLISQSGAASSMLEIVKKSLEGELARYLKEGKKANVRISGTADSSPIVGRIIYDGTYGDFEDEPVYNNGEMSTVTVAPKGRITQNEQLAFLRAQGVKKYLEDNVAELNDMKTSYRIDINVAEGKGSQYRRITTEITFVDAL